MRKNTRTPHDASHVTVEASPGFVGPGPATAPGFAATDRFQAAYFTILHMLRPGFYRKRKLKSLIRGGIPFTIKISAIFCT